MFRTLYDMFVGFVIVLCILCSVGFTASDLQQRIVGVVVPDPNFYIMVPWLIIALFVLNTRLMELKVDKLRSQIPPDRAETVEVPGVTFWLKPVSWWHRFWRWIFRRPSS